MRNLSLGGLGLLGVAGPPAETAPEFIQKWSTMEVSPFGTSHVATLDDPAPEGSTVVLEIIDDPFRFYTCIDDEGNVYAQVYNDANTSYDKRYIVFVCAGVVGTPQNITVYTWFFADFTSPANTVLRMYTTNWWRLSATVNGSGVKNESAAATGATVTITTTVDDCVIFSGRNTSASKTPTATAPSVLYRLDFQSGTPYTGAVSQHTAHRLCGTAGAHTVETTWIPEGNAVTRAFGVALEPM